MSGIDWLRVGLHADVTSDDYHADPCKHPSLSAHIAALLISHSPKHAWTAHPQLNPDFEREEKDAFDLGTAVHSLFLQGEDIAEWIDAKDWRTNDAQEQRAAARADRRIPLLLKHKPRVDAMLEAIHTQLPELEVDPPLFVDGKPEQTIIWEDPETGVTCRARLDWLRTDLRAIDDLKTAGGSANPHVWSRRTFWSIGCDLQATFYARGVHAITGKWPAFRFLVAECSPPYAVSVIDLAPSAWELGQKKCDYATRKWAQCLERGEWPSYDRHVASVEVDGWQADDILRLTLGEEIPV